MLFKKLKYYLLKFRFKYENLKESKYIIASNEYGLYCVPLSTLNRPTSKEILKGNIYEKETIAFVINNYVDGDIITAGTFFGDFLPAFSKVVGINGKIWAFEPNPDNYKCSQITVLLNDLKNIELFNNALGEKKEQSFLKIKENDGTFLGGASSVSIENIKFNVPIGIVTVDDSISSDRNISLIQLDVEGHELFVLKGSLKTIQRCTPTLIIEDNNNTRESDWFKENILKLGYKFVDSVHDNYIYQIMH
ncbi:MAG: FkbM family methyltransferase [Saprospiraceae bacterium]|nr:FkbM family methyltransferase [Saprospiraceae bacterium]